MPEVEEVDPPPGTSRLTPEQRRKLEEVRQKWDEKLKEIANGIENAGKINETDLAIRIVSRD